MVERSPPTLKLRRAKVELRGVEPRSKQETHTVSTCLALRWFSCRDWCKATDPNLSPLISPPDRDFPTTIPV